MQTEFEVKILDINVEAIKRKLNEIGATKVSEKNMKRYIYEHRPKKENSWIRLRTDGEKTTLAIKEIHNDNIDGTKETEIEVKDFEEMNRMMESLSYKHENYQETKRTSYELGKIKFEIDYWPKIPPYLEIEGPSAELVEQAVKQLGYEMKDTTSVNTKEIYTMHGIEVEKIKELKF